MRAFCPAPPGSLSGDLPFPNAGVSGRPPFCVMPMPSLRSPATMSIVCLCFRLLVSSIQLNNLLVVA
eukprot:9084558-Pyramimonas_sp.AAC.1